MKNLANLSEFSAKCKSIETSHNPAIQIEFRNEENYFTITFDKKLEIYKIITR